MQQNDESTAIEQPTSEQANASPTAPVSSLSATPYHGGRQSWAQKMGEAFSVEPFWFGLAALVVALLGQRIVTPGQNSALAPDFDSAKRLYVIAIAILLFGWWNSYTDNSLLALGRGHDWNVLERLRGRKNVIRLAVACSAALVNVLAISILRNDWYSAVGGWLWIVSMFGLILAFVGEQSEGIPENTQQPTRNGLGTLSRWAEYVAIGAILAVAVTMRLWRLGDLSPGMHGDEGEAGATGLDILRGVPISPFFRGWFTHSNVYFWTVAVCMKIFGTGLAGLRSWAVICGLVTVVFVYLIARDLFGVRTAIMAGFFIAFQSADLLMSRQLSSNAATPALTAVAFFCLVRGLRTRKNLYFAIAGVSAGFNVYYFAGGRLVAPTILAFFSYLALMHRAFLRSYWTRMLTFMIGVALALSPFVAYNMAYPLPSNAYPNDRFIWLHAQDLAVLYGSNDWRVIIWGQLQRTLAVITWAGDNSANHILDYPIARPLEAVLIVLGTVWALWRWRDTRFTLLSTWFWSSVIAGGVLTTDAPNVPRMVGMLPALAIIMAAWLDHFAEYAEIVVQRLVAVSRRSLAPWISGVAVASLVLVSGIQNWDKYINYYLNTHTQPDVTQQAAYVQQQGLAYRYYDLGAPELYFTHGNNRFINPHADGIDALNPPNLLPIVDNGSTGEKSVDFLVWANMYDYLPVLRAYYPEGRQEAHPFGNPQDQSFPLMSYVVTRAQIDSHRVMQATYLPRRGLTVVRREAGIGSISTVPSGLAYPLRARWRGAVVTPTYGPYRFKMVGPVGSKLTIDGKTLLSKRGGEASLTLAQGVHALQLTTSLRSQGTRVRVFWSPLGASFSAIPRRYLWDGHIGMQWQGAIYQLQSAGTRPITRRIDGFLGFRATQVGVGSIGQPFSGRWRGALSVTESGMYGFQLRSNGSSALVIDNKKVINNPGDGDPHVATGTISLQPGLHSVEVRYTWQAGTGYLETWWTPVGGRRQLFITPQLKTSG